MALFPFQTPVPSKFKDKQGRWFTKSLFREYAFNAPEGTFPLFTLYPEDVDGITSLYRLYMEEADASEYFFAKKHLGGWEHWQKLSQSTFFKPYIQDWRKELEVLIRAKALQKLIEVANNPTHKSSYDANKLLVKEGYKEKEKTSKRGRPTKDEITKEATRIASEEDQIKQDLERLVN